MSETTPEQLDRLAEGADRSAHAALFSWQKAQHETEARDLRDQAAQLRIRNEQQEAQR
jgi:hypothetical protein